jgi:hypothetical protein
VKYINADFTNVLTAASFIKNYNPLKISVFNGWVLITNIHASVIEQRSIEAK